MKHLWSAATVSLCFFGTSAALSAQDVAAGEKVFRKCAGCHKIGEGARNSVGPVLNDVFGRPAGSFEGYAYSKTLAAANEAGLIWEPDSVSAYIADPKAFMTEFLGDSNARPKMTFKLKNAQDRKNVIAYLQKFSQAAEPDEAEMDRDNADNAMEQEDASLIPVENKVCVLNASPNSHFFAAEGKGVERVTATLSPGQRLCAAANGGQEWAGVVSVYEADDGIEGCSRLVKSGTVEQMLKYVDFDRCFWSSNSAI